MNEAERWLEETRKTLGVNTLEMISCDYLTAVTYTAFKNGECALHVPLCQVNETFKELSREELKREIKLMKISLDEAEKKLKGMK